MGTEPVGRGDSATHSGTRQFDSGRILGADGQPMNYRVIWIRKALDELTTLWTAASNRAAVTAASHLIDQQLARDPLNYGESRGGADRIAFEAPLAVLF